MKMMSFVAFTCLPTHMALVIFLLLVGFLSYPGVHAARHLSVVQPSISNFSPPLSLEPFSSIHPSSLQQSYLPQFGNNSMLLQACRVVQFNQADIRQLIDRTSTRPCIAMEFCVEKVSNTPALSYVKLNWKTNKQWAQLSWDFFSNFFAVSVPPWSLSWVSLVCTFPFVLFFGEEIVGHQFLLHFQGMLVHVHQRGFSQEKLVSPVIW